jgi:hypothetical protein
VRYHGPGTANADLEGARNTIASAGSPALLAEERASSEVRPNGHARPGLPTSAPQGAPVCSQRYRLATVAWVLHDSRGNTFRFVVCRNSIQGAMALQLRVSDHQWQPHDGSSIARLGESAGGGESRARSGWCQPARRTTGRRAFSSVSNHGGGSIEVV